jgi:hypothetical protein
MKNMKKLTITFAAFALLLGASMTAAAQTKTPQVNDREQNQKQRIVRGVKHGKLYAQETAKLLNQQARIRKAEHNAKKDGKVTFKERARLHHELNQASRNIRRKKNN